MFLSHCFGGQTLCPDLETQRLPVGPKEPPKQKVIVIAGPTGCGKSEFAMMLAKATQGEILSADSMQVYRGMDIGTAKATREDRLKIPHHLLDIRDVNDPMNVVDFYHEICFCLHTIRDRETIPIVVGGSGFYLHALLYGPPVGPPSSPEVRGRLEHEIEQLGSQALYDRLYQLDSDYASTVTCHDKHKIVRALEIIELTGKKVSDLDWRARPETNKFDFHCWFLHRPRPNLYQRIERRCDRMIQDGLLEEVERLDAQGLRQNSSAAQAIGYRQALEYLGSEKTAKDYAEFVQRFKQATRQYAKRQLTWFRRESLYRWLDIDAHDFETAMELVLRDLDRR